METMTDTPETDQAECESIAAYIESYGPDAVFPCDGYDHARKLERERDEAREHVANLEVSLTAAIRSANMCQDEAEKATAGKERLERERDDARSDLEFRRDLYKLQSERLEGIERELGISTRTLGEVREILCDALPNENQLTSFMAATLVKERDEAWVLADRLAALLQRTRDYCGGQIVDPECGCFDCEYLRPIDEALAAWKEARK